MELGISSDKRSAWLRRGGNREAHFLTIDRRILRRSHRKRSQVGEYMGQDDTVGVVTNVEFLAVDEYMIDDGADRAANVSPEVARDSAGGLKNREVIAHGCRENITGRSSREERIVCRIAISQRDGALDAELIVVHARGRIWMVSASVSEVDEEGIGGSPDDGTVDVEDSRPVDGSVDAGVNRSRAGRGDAASRAGAAEAAAGDGNIADVIGQREVRVARPGWVGVRCWIGSDCRHDRG